MIHPKIRRWIGLSLLLVGVVVAVLGVRAYGLLAWAGDVETVRFESPDGVGHSLGRWSRFWNAGFPDGYFEFMVGWAQTQSAGVFIAADAG